MTTSRIITVFGSASALPDSADYQAARRLGRLLAQAGFAVATGGYAGLMEAASRGAAEAGGHVIAVTCATLEESRQHTPNGWVREEIRLPTLGQRIHRLVTLGQGAVALPGGIGTLAELALLWDLTKVGEMPRYPIVAVGEGWARTLRTFLTIAGDYVHPQAAPLLSLAPTVEDVLSLLLAQTPSAP